MSDLVTSGQWLQNNLDKKGTPEFNAKLQQYEAAKAQANQENQPHQGYFDPTPKGYQFNWGNVAKSAAAGAGIGGAMGTLIGPEGAVPGALGGAVWGGLGGMVDEAGRSLGFSPAASDAASAIAGGGGSLTKKIGTWASHYVHNLPVHYLWRNAATMAEHAAEDLGLPATKFSKEAQAYRDLTLGKRATVQNVQPTEVQDSVKAHQNQILSDSGYPVNPALPASKNYLKTVQAGVTSAAQQGMPFIDSPEFTQLAHDMQSEITAKNISPAAWKDAQKLLADQGNPDPAVQNAITDLTKGTTFGVNTVTGKGQRTAIMADSAAKKIANAFNNYLERISNSKFSLAHFDQMYQNESIAKSADQMGTFLRTGFKSMGSEENMKHLANIARADPQVQDAFRASLLNHFATIPASKMVQEFDRMTQPILQSGALSPKTLNAVREQLRNFPKTMLPAVMKAHALGIMKAAIDASAGSAILQPLGMEGVQPTVPLQSPQGQ